MSPRLIGHEELGTLTIAHLDCDAFFAAVEKRDNPALRDMPVVIGGGKRGVVSTACYIARTFGVHSAQPMFKALKACPDAVVIKPDIKKYVAAAREIRDRMLALTPLVEPLSLDEAFLDLTGTERLHRSSAAEALIRLQRDIELQMGLTVSIGLSYNKFLAKLGSELDKPRGFSVIGQKDALVRLAPLPVSVIFGVGKRMQASLLRDGIATIGDLQSRDEAELIRKFGAMGPRLFRLSRGIDSRSVDPASERKAMSAETTLENDHTDFETLRHVLWRLAERVSERAKTTGIAGQTIILKLKTKDFALRSRHRRLPEPTQLADRIYKFAEPLLKKEVDGTAFRLIGVGLADLCEAGFADLGDLAEPDLSERRAAETAIDTLRAKFGRNVIGKGRGLT